MILDFLKLIRRRLLGNYRLFLLKLRNQQLKVGKNFYSGYGIFISKKNKIKIGDNFYMGNYCHLAANAEIADNVLFASYVSLVGGDHKIDNISGLINQSGRDALKTIIIEDNVWIGHGSIIMHGVIIKKGAVIAAGSIVTKDVPQNAVFGGNPARMIRYRKF